MNTHLPKITLVFTLSCTSQIALAGFDFCSGNGQGGNNSFQQQIPKNQIAEIGELPSGIDGINIQLRAQTDLDIQLYDKQTGTKIIKWPDGILRGGSQESTYYDGIAITWSGYNGDGTGTGNEFIKINGKTNHPLIMKVFGYAAGNATVNYTWNGGSSGCQVSATGGDIFQQNILHHKTVTVGTIPSGIDDLYIKLTSDRDVDIQLFDQSYPIVQYPNGKLRGGGLQKTSHEGMDIEWSGYNGDGTGAGHEYIKIIGTTTRPLIMKAFGYQAGYASIEYSWGKSNFPPVNNIPLQLIPGSDTRPLQLSGATNKTAQVCTFKDVIPNQWYERYVNALCSAGIVVGYYESSTPKSPTYRPGQAATIAESLKVLNYASHYEQTQQRCQSTVGQGNWYQCHITIANEYNVLPSKQNSSAASMQITRGDAFVYTAKAFFNVHSYNYDKAVTFLQSKGVVTANQDPKINNHLTRAELAAIAIRAAYAANKKLPYGLVPQPRPDKPLENSTGMPDSSTPSPIENPKASGFGHKIVAKAKKELGKKGYPWTDHKYTYCARFVRMMFDKGAIGHAYKMCDHFRTRSLIKSNTSIAPAGSVICYPKNTPGSGGYGHIAIATGDGTEIGVTSLSKGVTQRTIKSNATGWISPETFRDHY